MSGDEGESERSDQAWLWTELCTDSQSAIDLLANQDLPRRSRHVEIRIAWLRHQMSSGRVHLKWLSGVSNPADMFHPSSDDNTLVSRKTRPTLS